ncbi:hypothetical protein H5410_011470 [Solanum commersonii]|uniref:Uncharacterized protein n=1 Tax=Solanum commersonii TaxID=4109 RepID=A0A9J6APG6_SOLCO|nr:hypothetical protein H5410_011470 [Solanum commersonii]
MSKRCERAFGVLQLLQDRHDERDLNAPIQGVVEAPTPTTKMDPIRRKRFLSRIFSYQRSLIKEKHLIHCTAFLGGNSIVLLEFVW